MTNEIKRFCKHPTIQTIISLMGVGVVVINLIIASKLAPLSQDISVIHAQVSSLQDEYKNLQEQHKTFVTQNEFRQIVDRLDHISSRVDQIAGILMK